MCIYFLLLSASLWCVFYSVLDDVSLFQLLQLMLEGKLANLSGTAQKHTFHILEATVTEGAHISLLFISVKTINKKKWQCGWGKGVKERENMRKEYHDKWQVL